MIKKARVGLIYPGNQEQISFAWAVYSNDDENAEEFKGAFCRDISSLHFVGVWDAVASVGIFPRKPFPLMDKCKHVTHFRHALALDECRVKFLPEQILIEGAQTSKEVWFAGTHSDIGGGNRDNSKLDRGGEPLKWMLEEAREQGLLVRLNDIKIGKPGPEITNSMGWMWTIFEILPIPWMRYLPEGESVLSRQVPIKTPVPMWSPYPQLKIPSFDETQRSTSSSVGSLDGSRKSSERRPSLCGLPPKGESHDLLGGLKDMEIFEKPSTTWDDNWYEKLVTSTLGDEGTPEAIWAYEGPQLLQNLFSLFGSKAETKEIVQAIIGYDAKIPWEGIPEEPLSISDAYQNERERKKSMGSEERRNRLHDMIVPRTCLLLEEWLEPTRKRTHISSHPILVPYQVCDLDNPETSTLSWILQLFGFKAQRYEDIEVKWSWYWVPKEDRSVDLLITVIEIVSKIAALPQVTQADIDTMARLVAKVMSDPDSTPHPFGVLWRATPTLRENLSALPKSAPEPSSASNESATEQEPIDLKARSQKIHIAKTAFRDGSILPPLLPLLFEQESQLANPVLEATKLFAQKISHPKDAAVVATLVDYLKGQDRELSRAASMVLVVLLDNRWCYFVLDHPDTLKRLFYRSEGKELNYIDNVCQALLKTPTKYPYVCVARRLNEDHAHWDYMMSEVKDDLKLNVEECFRGQDRQIRIQALACLLRNRMTVGLPTPTDAHFQRLGELITLIVRLLREAPKPSNPMVDLTKKELLSIITPEAGLISRVLLGKEKLSKYSISSNQNGVGASICNGK
ncbi:positive histone H3-K79 methylation [Rhizoctonia solani]|uniref:Positive histone H3-K79 methylation n=1 Tax=Rhizoctonia solani TaxID=456999 RepID=A0A8H7H0V1_9AGAM|nr:positive histone H3-K79 methylation [Rhizoctonia solani]